MKIDVLLGVAFVLFIMWAIQGQHLLYKFEPDYFMVVFRY